MQFLTLKKLLSMFKLLNLSSLPASNPGNGNPWLHGSGSVVVGAFSGGGGGVTDHGALSGLSDDDHSQYYNASRLAAVLADYLPLAGGVITGELFIASGGGLYLYDPIVDTDQELTVVDGELFVGGVAVGGGDALTTNPLSQFAATTSAQLRGVISDETGTGALVFAGGNIGAATGTSLATTGNVTAAKLQAGTRALSGTDLFQAGNADQSAWFYVNVQGSASNIVPSNQSAYAAYAVLASGDTFGRIAIGLDNGTPFVGIGPGSGARDAFLSRAGSGIWNVGTSASNALGSVNLANLAASGTGTFNGNVSIVKSSPVLNLNDNNSSTVPTINFIQNGSTRASITAGTGLNNRLNLNFGANVIALGTGNTADAAFPGQVQAASLKVGSDASKGIISYTTNTLAFNSNGGNSLVLNGNFTTVGAWGATCTIFAADAGAGNANRFGNPLVLSGGQSTGSGAASCVIIQVSPTGSSGTAGNGFLEVARFDPSLMTVTGNITASGYIDAKHRPYTFAGLPLASAAQDKTFVCTDSTLAMNGTNYGTTPAGGGANRVKVFSNGTSWMVG